MISDRASNLVVRPAWCLLAGCCLVAGSIGAVLPILPTTPFLLVAAFAASRGSKRLSNWIENHRRFGPLLRDWRDHRALHPRTKRASLLVLAGGWLVTLSQLPAAAPKVGVSVVVLSAAIFLATRPAPPDVGEC